MRLRRALIATSLVAATLTGVLPEKAEAGRASNCSRPSSSVVAKTSKARRPRGDSKSTVFLDCSGAIHIVSAGSNRHFGAQVDQRHYDMFMNIVSKSRPYTQDGGNTWVYQREIGCRSGGGMRVYYSYIVVVVVDARNGRIVTAYVNSRSVDKRTWDQEVIYCQQYAQTHG